MELSSSDKERIQHQYDALAKKTLVGEAKSHRRTLAKRAAREVTFSDLSESELAQLFTTDEYESDYFRFQVSGFDVLVKNELLAEALTALPERKRDIVHCPSFSHPALRPALSGKSMMNWLQKCGTTFARRYAATHSDRSVHHHRRYSVRLQTEHLLRADVPTAITFRLCCRYLPCPRLEHAI